LRKFDAAQQIRAQTLKMAAHEAVQLPGRFFIAKRNGRIVLCQATIFSKNDPGTKAKKLPPKKEKPQWQYADNRPSRAIQKINHKIEHAESLVDGIAG